MLVIGKGSWHTDDCNGQYPSLLLSDGPHGLRIPLSDSTSQNNTSVPSTCYPTASAIACSWDRALVAQMAHALAQEARTAGVSIVLGPGINIKRSPLCGRNFEYYSEDPYLSGELGSAYVSSMQKSNVGTSLKHFAGNSQETHRQTANSQIDERALREIYLSAFEAVVKQAHPFTIMASYNRLNGTYACENKHLLTDILRKEWGFDGVVVSDWGACVNLAKCLEAGMDLEMPDSLGIHEEQLQKARQNGQFSKKHLDRATSNMEHLIEKLTQTSSSEESSNPKKPSVQEKPSLDYHALTCELSAQSAVLLKNDGMLPLSPGKIVVIGDLAVHMRFQGGGSSHITTNHTENALQCLTDLGFDITYAKGYVSENDNISPELEQTAIQYAKLGLPILFFGGLTDIYEGEGYDRKTLSLPKNQLHLLEIVQQYNSDIAFISFGGSPIDFCFADKVRSILHMYLGGEGVGKACADLISGQKNPCGKLAETYPYSLSDIPSQETFGLESDDIEYRESLFVGYRYYDSYQVPVQFCFGHGLSYTQFAYSDLQIHTAPTYNGTGPLSVSCKITNTGSTSGKEIVQLYVENPKATYLRPRKELRQFGKVSLKPGETKEITFELQPRSFSIYDDMSGQFLMPSGTYLIHLAASIEDIRLSAPIQIEGVDYQRDDTIRLSEYFEADTKHGFHISQKQFAKLYQQELSDFDHTTPGNFSTYHSLKQLSKHSLLGKIFLTIARRIVYGMFKGKPHNDPEVLMMIGGIEDGTIDSVICQSEGMIPYKVAEAIVLSANRHHLQAIAKLIRG